MVKIDKLTVGNLAENTYLVYDEEGRALVIDPGAEAMRIIERINELGLDPQAVLLTHTHHDHIGAVDEIRGAYDIDVYVHKIEEDTLVSSSTNPSVGAQPADHVWLDKDMGQSHQIGGIDFTLLFVPGHSPGHVAFLFRDSGFVVSGDTVFKSSIGRYDLPGSSYADLMDGIVNQIMVLPDDYVIHSGHGEATTIGFERATNPFLADFV